MVPPQYVEIVKITLQQLQSGQITKHSNNNNNSNSLLA
jgi:hypothetical protein